MYLVIGRYMQDLSYTDTGRHFPALANLWSKGVTTFFFLFFFAVQFCTREPEDEPCDWFILPLLLKLQQSGFH